MKDYFKLKTWLILAIMLVIGISSAALITYFEFKDEVEIARAGSGDNVAGFAWSENIGWISFNCTDIPSSCSGGTNPGTPCPLGNECTGGGSCVNTCSALSNYGVDIDPVTGNFSGYAWSSNISWISFNRSDTGAPPAEPYQGESETIIANYDSVTENITGWAKILALGDDGWINFNNPYEGELPLEFPLDLPIDFDEINFGVSIASSTSEFSGWAWNGGADDAGIGWISFNCADEGAGGCEEHDYKVYVQLNTPPQAANSSAPNWSYEEACALYARQAFLRWEFSDPDEESSQSAYQVIVDDDSDPADPLIDTDKVEESASQYPLEPADLDYNKLYYWWVKVWDNLDAASELTAGPSFTTYKHELPAVSFTWLPENPSRDEEVKFTDSSVSYGGATITDFLWTAPNASIDDSATSTPTIIFNSSGSQAVTLKVTDSDDYYCSLTENIGVNVTLPGWKEVKPE